MFQVNIMSWIWLIRQDPVIMPIGINIQLAYKTFTEDHLLTNLQLQLPYLHVEIFTYF